MQIKSETPKLCLITIMYKISRNTASPLQSITTQPSTKENRNGKCLLFATERATMHAKDTIQGW